MEAMLASIYPGVSTDSIRSAIKRTENLDAANFLAESSLKTPCIPQDIVALSQKTLLENKKRLQSK